MSRLAEQEKCSFSLAAINNENVTKALCTAAHTKQHHAVFFFCHCKVFVHMSRKE